MRWVGPHATGVEPNRVRWAMEAGAICAVLGISSGMGFQLWLVLEDSSAWVLAGLALGLGYVLADLLSGMVHWLADRYGSPETPLLGNAFIQPFREHHFDPQAITRHDFVETNGNNSMATLLVLIPAYLFIPVRPGNAASIFLSTLALAACLSLYCTNQFHKWAHLNEPPRLARILQRCRLVLPKEHHQVHHTAPFDTYYCITTGWLNWPLQKLRFFEFLEWFLSKVCLLKLGFGKDALQEK